MAADAQMMSHFYSPLHHMYPSMHSSGLHPHSRYPAPGSGKEKYPGNGYPEQKYDPQGHPGDSSPSVPQPPTLTPGPVKTGQPSPGSSPHHQPPASRALEAGAGYHGGHQQEVDRPYLTPPAPGARRQAPGTRRQA